MRELRVRCLEQFHQALIDHRDELAELTTAEVGATRLDVCVADITTLALDAIVKPLET